MEVKEPKLIAYRKESKEKILKVEKKLNKSEQNVLKTNKVTHQKEIIKERVRCNCNGYEHATFSNCMGCGRILCILEGEGKCLNCGHDVFPPTVDKIPKEYLDDPEFKKALLLKDRLLLLDKEYASEGMRVNNLRGGWFEDSRNVFNEKREESELKWKEEEIKEKLELEIKKYDLDLTTGTFSMTTKQ